MKYGRELAVSCHSEHRSAKLLRQISQSH